MATAGATTTAPDSCAKYGRLYTWTGAMNIDSSYLSASPTAVIPTPHQGACACRRYVPTDDDWMTLENWAGGSRVAGTKPRARAGGPITAAGRTRTAFGSPAGRRHYSGDLGNVDSAAYSGVPRRTIPDYANDRELYNKYGFMDHVPSTIRGSRSPSVALRIECFIVYKLIFSLSN